MWNLAYNYIVKNLEHTLLDVNSNELLIADIKVYMGCL